MQTLTALRKYKEDETSTLCSTDTIQAVTLLTLALAVPSEALGRIYHLEGWNHSSHHLLPSTPTQTPEIQPNIGPTSNKESMNFCYDYHTSSQVTPVIITPVHPATPTVTTGTGYKNITSAWRGWNTPTPLSALTTPLFSNGASSFWRSAIRDTIFWGLFIFILCALFG